MLLTHTVNLTPGAFFTTSGTTSSFVKFSMAQVTKKSTPYLMEAEDVRIYI